MQHGSYPSPIDEVVILVEWLHAFEFLIFAQLAFLFAPLEFLVLCSLIQGADIGWNGTFQKLFDKDFLIAKQQVLKVKADTYKADPKKTNKIPRLTASEVRALIVEVGSRIWFTGIPEHDIISAGLRSGLAVAMDGSEDSKVDVVCPGSGKRLFPAREGGTASQAHQEGQGVVVVGHACEIVVQHSLAERVQADPEPQVPSKTVLSKVKVLHEAGDDQLRFPTQQEKEAKEKISVDESDGTQEESSGYHGDDEFQSESDAEPVHVLDDLFLQEAAASFKIAQVIVTVEAPRLLDESLVGAFVAFNHEEGWYAGTIIDFYKQGRWKKGFNYDIEYYRAPRIGSVRTRLSLDMYGIARNGNVPLSLWVLLEDPIKSVSARLTSKRKSSPKKSLARKRTKGGS
jgi:hypothetical protein